MSRRPRLILLNGLPGVGKSTLAREYVAARPGTLNLDIDVLRTLLGGPWQETAELGRSLALQIITAHLDSGHDVVVPQLVANPTQLARFEEAAADFEFRLVMVEGRTRQGHEQWRASMSADELRAYADGLDRIAATRPNVHHLRIIDDDVAATVDELSALLGSAPLQ